MGEALRPEKAREALRVDFLPMPGSYDGTRCILELKDDLLAMPGFGRARPPVQSLWPRLSSACAMRLACPPCRPLTKGRV